MADPLSFRFMDDSKSSAPGTAEPQRALGKLKSTRVKVPPVELDGSRPKAMPGMKPRGRSRKRDIV
jgi:hypothetical protein